MVLILVSGCWGFQPPIKTLVTWVSDGQKQHVHELHFCCQGKDCALSDLSWVGESIRKPMHRILQSPPVSFSLRIHLCVSAMSTEYLSWAHLWTWGCSWGPCHECLIFIGLLLCVQPNTNPFTGLSYWILPKTDLCEAGQCPHPPLLSEALWSSMRLNILCRSYSSYVYFSSFIFAPYGMLLLFRGEGKRRKPLSPFLITLSLQVWAHPHRAWPSPSICSEIAGCNDGTQPDFHQVL